ncbi:MAG: ABC transporter ATP-binding protein [Chloroflexota bacterium]|nr:ABC transporter ATP-binding protein [Chloroflexota bacterium]MDE2859170.1 ABC transporter ATP-binding protein [Chloroflexota bacterium]MDE2952840.1 ABC transporter ATP-binding protein [Chloroflexota bacterium]
MPSPLLQIRDATKIYSSGGFIGGSKKSVVALDNFNMTIAESPATITTIAGESGSGKTTLANLVLGFIKLSSGKIIFDGEDITDMTDEQLKEYRRNVQAVFQDPFGVYNPFYRIDHVFDLVNKHFSLSDNQSEYRDMVEAGLNVVGLYGEDVLRKYPHQLSGGQRQRIMMARAYMIKPRLIVADEPVSMVDASLRASILDAMLRLRDDHNISFLYITHDLSTAYQIGDQIYMLYQGTTAERGSAMDVIDAPQHPYVQLLIDSVPVPDPTDKWDVNISLPSEEEMRTAASKGCRYYPRCPHRMDKCLEEQPPLFKMDKPKHEAACYLYEENDVAPIEAPIFYSKPKTDEVLRPARRSRVPLAAAAIVLIVAAAAAVYAINQNNAAIAAEATAAARAAEATDAAIAAATASAAAEEITAATAQAEAEASEPTPIPEQDFKLPPDGASDKGALALNVVTMAEIAGEGDIHRYSFEGLDGQEVTVKIRTGGGGLSGGNLNSPYGTIYGPDGEFVAPLGDTAVRPRRSYNAQLTLRSGTYTIIVGPAEVDRYGLVGDAPYQVEVEGDAPEIEPTPEPTPIPEQDFKLPPDGASDKGALALNLVTMDEIAGESDRHRYSFEGLDGQEVTVKIRTGGGGLSGGNLNSPYGTIYGPDGEFVAPLGDTAVRPRRSYNAPLILRAGIYTVIVGAAEVDRYGLVGDAPYQVEVEGDEPAPAPEPTALPEIDPTPLPRPDFILSSAGAQDKGSLTIEELTKDEITDADDKHSYRFTATAGQDVSVKIRTGGSGLSGGNLNSPYATIYGPDGEFVAALGDTAVRPRRSYNAQLTLKTGDYSIIVGSAQVDRYGLVGDAPYQLIVESAGS